MDTIEINTIKIMFKFVGLKRSSISNEFFRVVAMIKPKAMIKTLVDVYNIGPSGNRLTLKIGSSTLATLVGSSISPRPIIDFRIAMA